MGLVKGLITLPLAPLSGVVRLAGFLQERAEQQLYDPVLIRRQLEDVSAALAAGEISEEEAVDREDELLHRLLEGRARGF
jgi:hypothetical protein